MASLLRNLALLFLVLWPAPDGVRPSYEEDLAALEAEFQAVHADWKAAVREASDSKERRALRKQNPVPEYLPRFEELARGPAPRAWFWVLDHLKDAGGSSRARTEKRAAIYTTLFDAGQSSDLVFEAGQYLLADSRFRRKQGLKEVERWVGVAGERLEEPRDRARLDLGLALLFLASRDEATLQRGVSLVEEILAAFPELPGAKAAEDRVFMATRLRKGGIAPEFEGESIDGRKVRLEDYRGKVVVLDFFGFW